MNIHLSYKIYKSPKYLQMFSGEDIFNLCYFVLSLIKHYLDLAKRRTESSHEARISFQNKQLGWEITPTFSRG